MFHILEELVLWENTNNSDIIGNAKEEIRKCMGSEAIALLDPFSGGGAIPLEAQRLGLKAFAQDLNPISVTINKAMIEIPPLFANCVAVNPESQRRKSLSTWEGNNGLAADVEYYGAMMKEEAYKRIGHLYPSTPISAEQGGGEATVIAWIWARTVKCPNPACGCETPLIRSFELSRKKGNEWYVSLHIADGEFYFSVKKGKCPHNGTVNRKGATCIHCATSIGFPYIREEGSNHRMSHRLMGMIAEGKRGRVFAAPNDTQVNAASVVKPEDYPDAPIVKNPRNFNTLNYGLVNMSDLYTNRQLTALTTFSNLVVEITSVVEKDALAAGLSSDQTSLCRGGTGAKAYGEAISVYLAFLVDQLANHCSSVCSWHPRNTQLRNTFSRQAIPMTWDYAESNPFCNSSGSFANLLNLCIKGIKGLPTADIPGVARQFDAQSDSGMRNIVISTDPPYYDNICYADLSDYFYIWLRRSLRDVYPELFRTMLVPKNEELVATPYRNNRGVDAARVFFEEGMFETLKHSHTSARDDVPVTIYYAFKQSETETSNQVVTTASTGWETMLSAIIRAGFEITGTWPMRTEMGVRMIASGTNALASSIVLVCRKRSVDAAMATRRDFVNALKRELRPALDKLQTCNIAPVDMAQSAIGPGIGVYSRFSKVLEADGTEMTVRSALQIINQELDLYFSDQDSDLDRESRFCVDLFTQIAFNEIRFGEADVLARAKNTSIDGLKAKGALSSSKGIVRLLGRDEISDTPEPSFCWLFTQQLTHAMETGGIEACAKMLKGIYDGRAENAKALAYRLFTIADKKKWNQEAFAYNSLVVAWPEIQSRAAQLQEEQPVQTALDI